MNLSWLYLVGLVGCECALVVLFLRWYACLAAGRGQHFSKDALSRLMKQTILLCLAALPFCLCLCLFIWFRLPAQNAFGLVPLALSPFFLIVVFGIAGWFFVIFVPRWPTFRYVFFLPTDEEELRLYGVREGILAAASVYPEEAFLDDEELDTFVRSGGVVLKTERFPASRFRWYRLTNDFAQYCDLLVDGYRRGYRRFFAECQAGDHSQVDREHLRSEGAQDVLSVHARRYLQGV
jgi:hypothetical protein